VYPVALADHLSALLTAGVPDTPIHLGNVVE
jgi:hypothetical protein